MDLEDALHVPLSKEQIEAATLGEQHRATAWLAARPIAANIFFILFVIAGGLWLNFITTAINACFGRGDNEAPVLAYFILALVWNIGALLIGLYVYRLPITAAFTF